MRCSTHGRTVKEEEEEEEEEEEGGGGAVGMAMAKADDVMTQFHPTDRLKVTTY